MGKGLDDSWSYAGNLTDGPSRSKDEVRDELALQVEAFKRANGQGQDHSFEVEPENLPPGSKKGRVLDTGMRGERGNRSTNYAIIELDNGERIASSFKKDFLNAVQDACENKKPHLFYLDRNTAAAGSTRGTNEHSGERYQIRYHMLKNPSVYEPDIAVELSA